MKLLKIKLKFNLESVNMSAFFFISKSCVSQLQIQVISIS